jgi:hypothetical protein
MISIGGVLYIWILPGSALQAMQREARIYRSRDHAASWEPADWKISGDEALTIPTIC